MDASEALREFIGGEEGAAARFAQSLEISQSYLSNLLAGRKRASLPLARRIEVATDGAVPMQAWTD